MTEKEKMLAGDWYCANDPLLAAENLAAKELCHAYNALSPRQKTERLAVLKRLLSRVGKEPHIEPVFFCDYGYNVEIGDYFFANYNLVLVDPGCIRFGNHVLIGPNCGFYTAGHPLDVPRRNAGIEFARPITVGDNVWFGGGVTVLPGVTVGEGSVIGGGSVVVQDIPAHVVAVGNPCRPVRRLDE